LVHTIISIDNLDLFQSNGIYVSNEKITPNIRFKLSEGDSIGIGLPVDCEYPDLEDVDLYSFKLIKTSGQIDNVNKIPYDIIDLTVEDGQIKQEVILDLEKPIEIVDDDDDSFSVYEHVPPQCSIKETVKEIIDTCMVKEKGIMNFSVIVNKLEIVIFQKQFRIKWFS
jgi:hypothetical protein